jgi:hypothetical protein
MVAPLGSWRLPFPASPAVLWPIWNHLATITINPWWAPALFLLLSAEMYGVDAELHRESQGTHRGLGRTVTIDSRF